MIGKKIVFDIIFLEKSCNFLELKFKMNDNFVDFYIICKHELFQCDVLNQIPEGKVFFVNFDGEINNLSDEEFFELQEKLLIILKSNYKNFDDLIFISKSNQIVDMNTISKDETEFFSFLNLRHKVLEKTFDLQRKYEEKGTSITNFSFFISQKFFLKQILKSKKISPSLPFEKVYGWNLENFSNGEISKDSDLLYKCPLYNNNVTLYPNHDVLSFGKKIEYKNKKIAFFVDSKPNSKINSYNKVFKVKTINQFPEIIFENTKEIINDITLYVPNEIIYGDRKDFKKRYIKNELCRIMNRLNCNDDDKVYIFFEDGEKLEFEFSQIKNPS